MAQKITEGISTWPKKIYGKRSKLTACSVIYLLEQLLRVPPQGCTRSGFSSVLSTNVLPAPLTVSNPRQVLSEYLGSE